MKASLPCFTLSLIVFCTAAGPLPADESGQDWTRFHGSDGEGVAAEGNIPTQWDDDDYAWRRKLGSRDVGSPAIVDGKIYYLVSNPDENKIVLESLDLATGKLRWSKSFDQRPHHLHNRNTFASSTPAVDERNIFISYADPQQTVLRCLNHDGEEIWSRNFGTWQSQHGFGTSPRIHGDQVLLFNSQQGKQLRPGQTAGQSVMIAVDRKSGSTVWETPLTTTRSCYGIPAIYQASENDQVIDANTGDGMFGLDAKTGKMLWNLEVFEQRCCSTPLISGNIAIASSGSGGGGNHLVGVRIPSRPGEQPEQVYRLDRGAPYVPTPVLHDKRLYIIDDKGIATCIHAQTGKTIWGPERVGGSFGASPVLIGDKLLLISLDGIATILKAGDEFEKLGEVDLGGPVGATPAYAEGRLLLRVGDELRCLGAKTL